MNRKIVITGLSGSNNTLLALSLSNLTDIPYIRNKTMYEWLKLCKVPNSNKLRWKDMLMIASVSFFERVAIESHYDNFISDGISFSELIWLKSHFEKYHPNKKQDDWNRIIENIERASAFYAARQYDIIIHARTESDISTYDYHKMLYKKYDLTFKVYNAENLAKVIREIVNDFQIRKSNTVESAINQAKIDIFKNY